MRWAFLFGHHVRRIFQRNNENNCMVIIKMTNSYAKIFYSDFELCPTGGLSSSRFDGKDFKRMNEEGPTLCSSQD